MAEETFEDLGYSYGETGKPNRNPEPVIDEDPRKTILAAPSFEEYMKQRAAENK
jgi:hypothetical protein